MADINPNTFGCEVDLNEFAKLCRAPVYSGEWNIWEIFIGAGEDYSIEGLKKEVLDLLEYWFDASFMNKTNVDNVEIEIINDSPAINLTR